MITPRECNIPSGSMPTFEQELAKLEDNIDGMLRGIWQGRSLRIMFSGGYSQKAIRKAMTLYRKAGGKVTPECREDMITHLTFEPKDD